MPPSAGEVWTHEQYYRNAAGQTERKHLLILAVTRYEVIVRTLTSKSAGRPCAPACCHGPPAGAYASYFLGRAVIAILPLDTWVDLQLTDDIDVGHFNRLEGLGILHAADTLPTRAFCDALKCAANAPDTTFYQEKQIYQSRSAFSCP